MRRALYLVLLGCSSSPTDPAQDGGAPTDAGLDVAMDAAPTDAGAEASSDAGCSQKYRAPTPSGSEQYAAPGWSMYGAAFPDPFLPEPYRCDPACGAGGPYRYWTVDDTTPRDPTGCTVDTASGQNGSQGWTLCCATLVCTRHENLDVLCGGQKGYRCDGPAGEPLPTRAGCSSMPNGTAAEFCCPN